MSHIADTSDKRLNGAFGDMRFDIARLEERLQVFYLSLVRSLFYYYYHGFIAFAASLSAALFYDLPEGGCFVLRFAAGREEERAGRGDLACVHIGRRGIVA